MAQPCDNAMDENYLDAIILGTGLTESILAAALSKAGFKVAHVDVNRYYGGDEASLSLDELAQWVDERAATDSSQPRYARVTRRVQDGLSQSRHYSISLCPSVIPSTGPMINSLISSGVSKYGGFRLVDTVAIYDSTSGSVKSVPGSKEDVFKSKELSLVDKRRIMRFLTFAMSDFEDKEELEGRQDMAFPDFLKSVFALNDGVASAIAYALAYCTSPSDGTLSALLRLRHYLRSAGRYGPSPFLVGHYGGTGEISQGFCRAAAVSGAIYILGRPIISIVAPTAGSESDGSLYAVNLEDVPDPLFCKLLIASPSMAKHLPPNARQLLTSSKLGDVSSSFTIARGIAIIDFPITFGPGSPSPDDDSEPHSEAKVVDTGIILFPPLSLPGGSPSATGTVFMTGEGSMSAPRGKSLIYIALPLESEDAASPEALLKPYLDATLSLAVDTPAREPLLTAFYLERMPGFPSDSDTVDTVLVTPPLYNERLPEAPDKAVTHAEEVFWKAVQFLQRDNPERTIDSFWTGQESEPDDEW